MSKQIQLRRGTTAQHSTFTGAEGECTVDTTKDTVVVHDGATVGGYPLSKEPSSQTLSGYTIASSAALPASSDTINQAIGKLAKQLTANGILKSNGTVVSAATAGSDYLNTSDIIDTLVSTSTTDALSANMGKSLQDTKSALPAAQVLTDYAIAETASLPASTDTINSAIGKLSKTASDTTSQLADYATKQYINPYASALGFILSQKIEPVVLQCVGDSTSNHWQEFFGLTMLWLSEKFKDYTFLYELWSDPLQNYNDGFYNLRYGDAGEAYAAIKDEVGAYISTPDHEDYHISGDIDIRFKVAMDDWTPPQASSMVNKLGGGGALAWNVFVGTTGKIAFYWSADGTNLILTISTIAPTINDGNAIWIRVTLDVDNGNGGHTVTFYTSTNYPNAADGNWVQLGDAITYDGITQLATNTNPIEFSGRGTGSAQTWNGKYYAAEIRDGINGKIVSNFNAGWAFPASKTSFIDIYGKAYTRYGNITFGNGSPMVLVLNSSCAGKNASYPVDVSRFDAMFPVEPLICFVNFGHNDNPIGYQPIYEELCAKIRTKYPNTGIICIMQNPQIPPRTAEQVHNHYLTQKVVAAVAGKNGYTLIDTYSVFHKTGQPETYMQVDGVHPNINGSELQRDKIIRFFAGITE